LTRLTSGKPKSIDVSSITTPQSQEQKDFIIKFNKVFDS